MKLVRMFVLKKLGHVRSVTRLLGQMIEKPCVRSRGHIFRLCQKLCLDGISHEFENGSCQVKS